MPFLQNLKSTLTAFGQDIVKSCYDVEWYRSIRATRWVDALKYMAALMAILSAIMTAVITPGVVKSLRGIRQFVESNVPAGASFSIKDGRFYTTLPAPSSFKLDQAVVIIDPTITGMDFPKDVPKDTVAIVGGDAIFLFGGANERQVRALKEMPDFDVTKEQIVNQLKSYGPWVAAGLLVLLFLAYYGSVLAGNMIFVAVTAVMMMLAARLWKVRLTVGQFAAVGFHAVTLPTLVDLTTVFFGLRIPYIFTGIYLLIMVAVVMDERNKPVAAGEAAVPAESAHEMRIPPVAPAEPEAEEKPSVLKPEKPKRKTTRRAPRRKKSAAPKPPEENQQPPVMF